MTKERAWELADRLIPHGLIPEREEQLKLRCVIALALLPYEEVTVSEMLTLALREKGLDV